MPRLSKAAVLAERQKLVNDYGRLAATIAPAKAQVSRLEQLGKTIRSWYDEDDPTQARTIEASDYGMLITARGHHTEIVSMEAVYRRLGPAKFFESCTMTIKALETVLTPAEVLALTERRQTGSRKLESFPLGTRAA